MTNRNKAKHY